MNYKKRYNTGNYRRFLAGGVDESTANALNMYNTGQIGSGNSPIGSTSTIVEQESNPELQQLREQALIEEQQRLLAQQQQVQAQVQEQEIQDELINEQKLREQTALREASIAQTEGIASTGIKTGMEFLSPDIVEANKLKNANAYSTLGSDIVSGFKAMKPQTMQVPLPSTLSNVVSPGGLSTIPSSAMATVPNPLTGFKAGLGQIGQGLGKFAKTGAGIGTIASLAGMGISRLSDDDDPTTVNFGEGAGSVLSSAGTGASIGSLLGPGGTLIGGVLGGAWGLGKSLFNRNKARKEEKDLEQETTTARNVGVNRFNEDLLSNYGSQLSNIRQGELAQKSISGQDLGYNLVAREGGVRGEPQKYFTGGLPDTIMGPLPSISEPPSRRIGAPPFSMMPPNINPNAAPLYGPGYKEGGVRYHEGGVEVHGANTPEGFLAHPVHTEEGPILGPQNPGLTRGQNILKEGMGLGLGRIGSIGGVGRSLGAAGRALGSVGNVLPEITVTGNRPNQPISPIVNNPNIPLGSEGMPPVPIIEREGGVRYNYGGFPIDSLSMQGAQPMQGIMPMQRPINPVVNNPNLILGSEGMSSIPMVQRGGGFRMGMPRYGYGV